jgi:hypothetical protein
MRSKPRLVNLSDEDLQVQIGVELPAGPVA